MTSFDLRRPRWRRDGDRLTFRFVNNHWPTAHCALFLRVIFRPVAILLGGLLFCGTGCGSFMARRIAQAPNSYPKWLAPEAPVALEFDVRTITAFPNQFLEVKSPPARLRYRIVEPGNYEFGWTNRFDEAQEKLTLQFNARVDNLEARTNQWSANPRGTVVLVHGYGVAGFAMLPWAFLLGQEGWRCVLVDMRGHGKSTGENVHFGTAETRDLSLLLDELEENGRLAEPVSVLGDSLGGVVALRWKLEDSRVTKVVSMSPYRDLGIAISNIADQYARWLPKWWLKAGVRNLPSLLDVEANELNPGCWVNEIAGNSGGVLFVAGGKDRIAPRAEVRQLFEIAGGESNRFIVVPEATHEALPFMFDDLVPPVLRWLAAGEETVLEDRNKTNASHLGAGG